MSISLLSTLQRTHPRLLACADDFERLRRRLKKEALLQEWVEVLRSQAKDVLQQPVSRYEIPDGLRLLATSQRVKERAYVLALMYRQPLCGATMAGGSGGGTIPRLEPTPFSGYR